MLAALTELKKQTPSSTDLGPISYALTEIQSEVQTLLKRIDIAPVTTGLNVLNTNIVRLANGIDDERAERAQSAEAKIEANKDVLTAVLKETVKGLVPQPKREPAWRRIGMPAAIAAALLFSAIAAFRPAPSRPDLAPKIAELTTKVADQEKTIVKVIDTANQQTDAIKALKKGR